MADFDTAFGDLDFGDVASCPVCRDVYNPTDRCPMMLPCGHAVCDRCMKSIIGPRLPQHMMCPVCRTMHTTKRGKDRLDFPKAFQMLSIFERMLEIRQIRDNAVEAEVVACKIECKDCAQEFSENEVTQCNCVEAPRTNLLDFLGRPKNQLICSNCIRANHVGHEWKPIDAVNLAWNTRVAMRNMKNVAARISRKTEFAVLSLQNTQDQLKELTSRIDRTVSRLDGRPVSPDAYSVATNFNKKLEDILKSVSDASGYFHKINTNFAKQTAYAKDYAQVGSTRPVGIPPYPHRPDADAPAANGDDLLRIGRNGNFRLHLRIEDIAGMDAAARQRNIELAAQRRFDELIPIIRNGLNNVWNAPGIEVRIVQRPADEENVGDGAEAAAEGEPEAVNNNEAEIAERNVQRFREFLAQAVPERIEGGDGQRINIAELVRVGGIEMEMGQMEGPEEGPVQGADGAEEAQADADDPAPAPLNDEIADPDPDPVPRRNVGGPVRREYPLRNRVNNNLGVAVPARRVAVAARRGRGPQRRRQRR